MNQLSNVTFGLVFEIAAISLFTKPCVNTDLVAEFQDKFLNSRCKMSLHLPGHVFLYHTWKVYLLYAAKSFNNHETVQVVHDLSYIWTMYKLLGSPKQSFQKMSK